MKMQKGFTLIELIVVIVILGILAATALPRFTDLQTDARLAKIQGALASLQSAAALAHATALVQNTGNALANIQMEGQPVSVLNAYPTANAAGIGVAAGGLGDYVVTAAGGAGAAAVFTIAVDAGHANCAVSYTSPAGAGVAPIFSAAPVRANCQ